MAKEIKLEDCPQNETKGIKNVLSFTAFNVLLTWKSLGPKL
jgi:hypothetical protein